jgi:pimeloyl-ACP methyl ester carboxylesterase
MKMCIFLLATFVISSVFAAKNPFKDLPGFANIQVTPITIEKDGVTIHGYRFKKSGQKIDKTKRPLLFTHGLGSNLHEFTGLLPGYVEAGQDCFAFNFRGHGNDIERSFVSDYREGDYAFEKLAHEDFPLMIEKVQEFRNEKINIFGHSMGGMVPRAALHDRSVDSGKINAMVLVGSPAHFRSTLKWTKYTGTQLALRTYLNVGSGQSSAINVGMLERVLGFASGFARRVIPFYEFQKAAAEASIKSVLENEFGTQIYDTVHNTQLKKALSRNVPKDIFRSFADFQKNGYRYENVPISVPITHIVGEKDVLAPPKGIIESAQIQSAEAGFQIIGVKGLNHFGIVSDWVASEYLDETLQFLNDPRAEVRKPIEDLSPRQTIIRVSGQILCKVFYTH